MKHSEDRDYWRSTYFPHLAKRRDSLIRASTRLVHYTTGMVAASILERREIWMRNASTMNDFREVEYGLDLLVNAWRRKPGLAFQAAVNNTFPGMVKLVAPLIDTWQPLMRHHTYLTCVSEHDASENEFGRLSMWRAYGADCGVALILNPDVMQVVSPSLTGMFSVPVMYAVQRQIDDYLEEVASNIESSKDAIQERGSVEFRDWLFHLLRMIVLATKHPGFGEEKEWRVTYSPHLGPSSVLRSNVEIVRGTPQMVFKIPLKHDSGSDLSSLDLSRLIERIVVGPTQHPRVVADALAQLLEISGDANANTKVTVSDIPLRHL